MADVQVVYRGLPSGDGLSRHAAVAASQGAHGGCGDETATGNAQDVSSVHGMLLWLK
jgi:hypothetical protein